MLSKFLSIYDLFLGTRTDVSDEDVQAFVSHIKNEVISQLRKIRPRVLEDWNEVEDLTGKVLFTVKKRIDTFDPDRSFKNWVNGIVYKIVLYECSRKISKRAEPVGLPGQEKEEYDPKESALSTLQENDKRLIPEQSLMENEKKKLLSHCLLKLKPEYREVLHLLYQDDMTINEIASYLNIKPERVSDRIFRAKKSLKKKITEIVPDLISDYSSSKESV